MIIATVKIAIAQFSKNPKKKLIIFIWKSASKEKGTKTTMRFEVEKNIIWSWIRSDQQKRNKNKGWNIIILCKWNVDNDIQLQLDDKTSETTAEKTEGK